MRACASTGVFSSTYIWLLQVRYLPCSTGVFSGTYIWFLRASYLPCSTGVFSNTYIYGSLGHVIYLALQVVGKSVNIASYAGSSWNGC